MEPGVLLALVALLVLLGLAFVPRGRRRVGRVRKRLGAALEARDPADATIIDPSGQEIPLPEDSVSVRTPFVGRLRGLATRRSGVALFTLLLTILVLAQLPRLLPDTPINQFAVYIAPFRSTDGTVGPGGRELARDLAVLVQQQAGDRLVVQVLDVPPADAAAARAELVRRGGDVLVWGTVNPGARIDQPSMAPELVYLPSGTFAPAAWQGFRTRFAIPWYYQLSTAAINGGSTLPLLLLALADYGAGRYDSAVAALDTLLDDPASGLSAELPATVRGTVFWARADYAGAAAEMQRALAAPGVKTPALLYNNLGAILQDAGDPAARAAFNAAIGALGGGDLGELRVNLARESLAANQPQAAFDGLGVAQLLLPPSASLQIAQANVARVLGRYDTARAALDESFERVTVDDRAVSRELQSALSERLRADWAEQDVLLRTAAGLGAQGPVAWELEVRDPLTTQELTALREQSNMAIVATRELIASWQRIAAAEDARAAPLAGRIAEAQAQQAERDLLRRELLQASVDIELLRSGVRRRQGVAGLLEDVAGARSPEAQARVTLTRILAVEPENIDALLLLARLDRIAGQIDAADQRYASVAALAPTRPEPRFGRAVVARARGDLAAARTLLDEALAINPEFFPARLQRAEIAEQVGDWPAAGIERAWLANSRDTPADVLALARALRQIGDVENIARAESILQPLADAGDTEALLELSRVYRAQNAPEDALSTLVRLQQGIPRSSDRYAEVSFAVGQLLAEIGRTAEAKVEFDRAISVDARHVPSLLALANLERDAPTAALGHYRMALQSDTLDALTLKRIGAELLQLGAAADSRDAYQRAIALPDGVNDADAHAGVAQAQLVLGEPVRARDDAQRAVTLRRGAFPAALVTLGEAQLQLGEIAAAESQFQSALQQDGDLASAQIGLGRVAAARNDWASAASAQYAAIRRDPNNALAYQLLGEALLQQQDPAGASAAFLQALAIREQYPEAHYGRARAAIALGDAATATVALDRALELQPRYAAALITQGLLDEGAGREEQARAAYQRAIDASDRTTAREHAEAEYRLGLLLVRAGEFGDARGHFERATQLRNEFPEAFYWLGRIAFSFGQVDPAIARYQRALEQQPAYAEAQYHLGVAQERAGRVAPAVKAYNDALAQGTGTPWADQARAALNRLGTQ